MSLEGDCHEVEVTPNLELLVTFGMSLDRVSNESARNFNVPILLSTWSTRGLNA
jgi:hypothetical protein